jgi:hypothetical protein
MPLAYSKRKHDSQRAAGIVSKTTNEKPGDEGGPVDASRATETPGTLLNGSYRLVRLLGAGGMGEVWEARHERTKGRVALKILLPEMGRREQVLQRFQREVEITSGLNHPNIVRVTDADNLPDGRPFLVMELLDGQDLSTLLAAVRPLGLARTLEIVEQVSLGLQAAHDQGVVHRDLKPANIFLVETPGSSRLLVKILDFGISKTSDGISKLTQTRAIMGTPNYMAPEQAAGGTANVDARADQFSLAAIAYEMLTGHVAFDGEGLVGVIHKVVYETQASFQALGVALDAAVEATVARGLSKDPRNRFNSVLEFCDELKRALGAGQGERQVPAGGAHLKTMVLPAVSAPTTFQSTTGQVFEAVNADASEDSLVAKANKRRVIAGVAGAGVLGAVLSIVLLTKAPAKQPPPSGRATSSQETSAATTPDAGAAAPAAFVAEVVSPSPDAGTDGAGAMSKGTATVARLQRRKKGTPKMDGGAAASATPATAPSPRRDCDPNFYLDARGDKHFKPECFLDSPR